jgi:hypothetical protein
MTLSMTEVVSGSTGCGSLWSSSNSRAMGSIAAPACDKHGAVSMAIIKYSMVCTPSGTHLRLVLILDVVDLLQRTDAGQQYLHVRMV